MSISKYRVIDVKKQHSMSFMETFRLCIKGVRHRLLRSVLTLAVVVLAVAFFMFLLSESMFLRATGRGVQEEIRETRMSQQLLTKFFTPATPIVMVRRLTDAHRRNDQALLTEFSTVTGISADAITSISENARREMTYINWLASIPSGKRTVLIQKRYGRSALDFILADREAFRSRLAPMIDLRVPGKLEGMEIFLDGYRNYAEEINVLTKQWNAKIDTAVEVMNTYHDGGRSEDTTWLRETTAEYAEDWRVQMERLGFYFPPEFLVIMRDQIAVSYAHNAVYRALNTQAVREEWAREFRESKPSTAEQKMFKLMDRRAINIFEGHFTPELLERVYEQTLYEQKLIRLERQLIVSMAEDEGWLGLSGRQLFLLFISFIVCMVGISNAMLMSITERFREIATMKCLGATDPYILMQFMMEAGMQGFFGGVLGVAIGFAIASLRGFLSFGSHLAVYWPWMEIGVCAVASLSAGVLLAVFASIHPSWSASRMAPMEAMRVE